MVRYLVGGSIGLNNHKIWRICRYCMADLKKQQAARAAVEGK